MIDSNSLMEMLYRCHKGENPEWVWIETYVNAESHQHPEDDG